MANFNPNELILDKVRSLQADDLGTGEMLFRLTSLEDSNLSCSAEGEEITDAVGSTIATLYKAKKAKFSATNSLFSTNLLAAQYGSEKVVADGSKKIRVPVFEIIEIPNPRGNGKVTLKHKPIEDSLKYIYSYNSNDINKSYKVGSVANATDFVLDVAQKTIEVPTGLTGQIYVKYEYESESAIQISNNAGDIPKDCSLTIFALFRDKCNSNLKYAGAIVSRKAKLNPEQVELALTSTGKHPFEFNMVKDYCSDELDDDLFRFIVTND